jgi:hypothetical protein
MPTRYVLTETDEIDIGLVSCVKTGFSKGLGFGTEAKGQVRGLGFNRMGCAHLTDIPLFQVSRLYIEVLGLL